ncbi:type II toxin-antitoxin system HicB family antitoxin [Effusibacillus pohliae]|uniref:type II toxin-antitoxin system HicB family antitoxin n=1 Tax=Effusibacillus pohliae TaxID=232270 RepID=UPI00035F1E1E|nr:toxin-antitoxin system HicB family antitoxin [Effusibacillus pohliae]
MSKKDLQYYLDLPYRIVLHPADEGGYVVEILELPGCLSQGETIEEALEMIEDAKRAWLEVALEEGIEIPEPARDTEEYSGKLNIRIPKSLHRILSEKAKEENVSLNQYINYQLSRGVGYPTKRSL